VKGRTSIADALTAETIDARYQDWRAELRAVLDSGREHRFEQVVYRDEHQVDHLLNLLCIALRDPESQQIVGGTLVIEDVTAAVGIEQRLAVSERMAAVGKLAARVAHELNNPLDGILRYINLALRAQESGLHDKIPDYLSQARGGLVRMAEIIRELGAFSRSTHSSFDDAGINAIIEESVRVLSEQAVQSGISIICQLNDDLPAIRGTNLFQVFCNLIKNAIDAMPNGGTLTVTSEVIGREAVIRFEDTGVGLPEDMDRIFEPFFTTKEPGKGTGLGLAICKDIIEKYNGRIVPERRPNGGTIFTIRLPAEDRTAGRLNPLLAVQPASASIRRSVSRENDA
jgi:signal transduction histidine kinase